MNIRTIIIIVLFAIALSIAITQYREAHPRAVPNRIGAQCAWNCRVAIPYRGLEVNRQFNGALDQAVKEADAKIPLITIGQSLHD